MAHFMTADHRFVVTPPSGEDGPYTVHLFDPNPEAGNFGLVGEPWMVNTLRDECSCAAIQGISCEHKDAVAEYVTWAVAQIEQEAKEGRELPEPKTADHRPKYTRRQVGMTSTKPARPIWATDVECSCGWTFRFEPEGTGNTKDQAKEVWKGHRDQALNVTPPPIHQSREDWLMAALGFIHDRAALFDYTNAPKTRVACGFTYGKGRRIGECWRKEQSGDGTFEVIVHNRMDNPMEVLHTLVHEVGHTFMEAGTGHKAPFKRYAKAMGLVGPATATVAGPELTEWLKELTAKLGTYPHAALDSSKRIREGGPKTQTNRWLKWTCSHPGCGWVIRTPKANFRGVCVAELHEDTPAMFIPGFTTEAGPTETEEEEEV